MLKVDLDQACARLREGQILIYPTETLYGLGVDIENAEAIEKLFSLKGRDPGKPISVLLPSLKELPQVVGAYPVRVEAIFDKFFPGPLTVVLPAHPNLDPRIHGGSNWVGVRVTSHPLAGQLMAKYGRPITTTSANPSGGSSSQGVAQLQDYFGAQELYLLSGGDLPPSRGSTVVKIDGENLQLLREGDIPFSEVQEVFTK